MALIISPKLIIEYHSFHVKFWRYLEAGEFRKKNCNWFGIFKKHSLNHLKCRKARSFKNVFIKIFAKEEMPFRINYIACYFQIKWNYIWKFLFSCLGYNLKIRVPSFCLFGVFCSFKKKNPDQFLFHILPISLLKIFSNKL